MLIPPNRFLKSFACLLAGLALLAGCNFPIFGPAPSVLDPDGMKTAAVETLQALSQERTQQAPPPTSPPSPTSAPTATFALAPTSGEPPITATEATLIPSLTPLASPSPIPISTSGFVLLRIIGLEATNCRTGPGPLYEIVGYLNKDQEATAYGRNDASTWWYITHPTRDGEFCWVWAQTTEVIGETANLEIITPSPIPITTSFTASFDQVNVCGSARLFIFRIENTGTQTLVWANIQVKDLATEKVVAGPENQNTPFMSSAGACAPTMSELPGRSRAYSYIRQSVEIKSGTRLRAFIILCTDMNQGGVCVEQRVTFSYP
jgi:hypothetical protein